MCLCCYDSSYPKIIFTMFLSILISEGDESCRKQLGRVLSIWQERAVYENGILDKLSDVLRK